MKKNLAIGIDIGGSHISCAAVDLVSGKILKETLVEREVNNQAHANVIVAVWTEAISAILAKVTIEKVKGIGFAFPGPFDYVNGICLIRGVAKYENLYGFNIKDAMSSSLGVPDNFPFRFINDASAFAVGEAWAGSASKESRSLAITLGTGFGSAFISNKIPVVDGDKVPKLGCVYYIPYRDGIADDYFSTRWFQGQYKSRTGKELKGVKELADLAATDKVASELFLEFGDKLGLFLAPYLIKFDAEILVIGGNISHAFNLFGEALEKRLGKENCKCRVALSRLKEDAALMGSAFLFDDAFWKDVQHALPLM